MAKFARIALFEVSPHSMDAVIAHFRDYSVGKFSLCDGFLGYQSFVDPNGAKLLGISQWATLAELQTSAPTANEVLAGAKMLGAALLGEPLILEEAFDTVHSPQEMPSANMSCQARPATG